MVDVVPQLHSLPSTPTLTFFDWKAKLYRTARTEGKLSRVRDISDNILVLFWADGCLPEVIEIVRYSEGRHSNVA